MELDLLPSAATARLGTTPSGAPYIAPLIWRGLHAKAPLTQRLGVATSVVQVPLGSIEIWEIRNATALAHSFHIHGIQFRVLDRDGNSPLPNELGLKDTVVVNPGSPVRVIAEFTIKRPLSGLRQTFIVVRFWQTWGGRNRPRRDVGNSPVE